MHAPDTPFDRFELGPATRGSRGVVREIIGYHGVKAVVVGTITDEQAGVQHVALYDQQMKRFPKG